MHPPPGIKAPFASVCTVERLSVLPIEAHDLGPDITEQAVLVAQIAIATKGHPAPLDADYTMEHEMAFGYLGQHGIAHLRMVAALQQRLVAPVFQEGAHTASTQGKSGCMSFVQLLYNKWQEHIIGHLDGLYLVMVLWHSTAAS